MAPVSMIHLGHKVKFLMLGLAIIALFTKFCVLFFIVFVPHGIYVLKRPFPRMDNPIKVFPMGNPMFPIG